MTELEVKNAAAEGVKEKLEEYNKAVEAKASKEALEDMQKGINANVKAWKEKTKNIPEMHKQMDAQATKMKQLKEQGANSASTISMTMQEFKKKE